MYVTSGTSNMTVIESGWNGVPGHPGSVTVILEVPFSTYIHTYTLPPDHGLLMPEKCRSILIQYTKNKQYIELAIIHMIPDARSTQYKIMV
jgi:hypothetical protein